MNTASSASVRSCECTECAGAVTFSRDPLRGEVVRCPECGVELEVTDTAPIALAPAPEVQEDWGE